jgi:mono/diheme cytochrome c family protein
MAKLPHMADSDMDAIVSFLRSDHPLVAADATPDVPAQPSFLTKLLCKVAWKPFPLPTEEIPRPDPADELVTGKYLAHNLDCFSCHSADFKTNNYLEPEKSPGYFAGGNMPLDLEGRVMYTSNLTPDKTTGIGNWTKDQFVRAVKYGEKEGEPALVYPMTPYVQLTDQEAGAIYTYLQSIPAIENEVERSVYD